MDNSDHKDKTVDNTLTIQTDVPNDGEASPLEHNGAPEDIGDPEESLGGLAGEAGELSEDADQEAGEPPEDPAGDAPVGLRVFGDAAICARLHGSIASISSSSACARAMRA